MRKGLALTISLAALLHAGSGWAQPVEEEEEIADDSEAEEEEDDDTVHFLPDWMTVGVGIMGQAGGNFFDKPGDQTVQGQDIEADYPGFAGLTWGVGPFLDVRFLGYVGFELGVLFNQDHGQADLDFRRTTASGTETFDYTIQIGHGAVHVPLLLKGSVPGEIVQPMLFLGPEFVVPGDADCRCGGAEPVLDGTKPSGTANYSAVSESYTMFTFGLGLEFMLPIPMVDIRIPFSLRGSYNPGVSDARDERSSPTANAAGDLQSETFKTNWKFQAVANFGLSWHF